MSKLKPVVVPVLGATGSGKSTFLLRMMADAKARGALRRCLIWNPNQSKTKFPGDVVTRLGDLCREVGRKGEFQTVFVAPWNFDLMRAQFAVVCDVVMEAENLTFVVEELKYVTRPMHAPDSWKRITGDGRQYGVKVIGTSQRPAQIDKDFLANATLIRTGNLAYPDDVDVVAKYMRIEKSQLQALRPLDWIESNIENGKILSGRLSFSRGIAVCR